MNINKKIYIITATTFIFITVAVISFYTVKAQTETCLSWDPVLLYKDLDIFDTTMKFTLLCDNGYTKPDINVLRTEYCLDNLNYKSFAEYAFCKTITK